MRRSRDGVAHSARGLTSSAVLHGGRAVTDCAMGWSSDLLLPRAVGGAGGTGGCGGGPGGLGVCGQRGVAACLVYEVPAGQGFGSSFVLLVQHLPDRGPEVYSPKPTQCVSVVHRCRQCGSPSSSAQLITLPLPRYVVPGCAA